RNAPRFHRFEPSVDLYCVEDVVRRQERQYVFFEITTFERPVDRYGLVGLEERDDGERRDGVVRYFVGLAVGRDLVELPPESNHLAVEAVQRAEPEIALFL